MNTTQMSFEMVIIGMQSSVWLYFLLIVSVGNDQARAMFNKINSLSGIIIAIGVFYIIGSVIDRLSGYIFRSRQRKIKKLCGLAENDLIMFSTVGLADYLNKTRVQIRVIRSTVINSIFIILVGTIYAIMEKLPLWPTATIGIIFLIIIVSSIDCYNHRQKAFFSAAKELEVMSPKSVHILHGKRS